MKQFLASWSLNKATRQASSSKRACQWGSPTTQRWKSMRLLSTLGRSGKGKTMTLLRTIATISQKHLSKTYATRHFTTRRATLTGFVNWGPSCACGSSLCKSLSGISSTIETSQWAKVCATSHTKTLKWEIWISLPLHRDLVKSMSASRKMWWFLPRVAHQLLMTELWGLPIRCPRATSFLQGLQMTRWSCKNRTGHRKTKDMAWILSLRTWLAYFPVIPTQRLVSDAIKTRVDRNHWTLGSLTERTQALKNANKRTLLSKPVWMSLTQRLKR